VIRVVSFRKVVLAGAAGAAAWETVLRPFLLAGVPTADMVRMLGVLIAPGAPPWVWWPAGMVLHAAVGVLWAAAYAYFFWSLFTWKPWRQGLAFALLPAALAILVMYPELLVMHASREVLHLDQWALLSRVTWTERAGLLLGHLVFGAVMGALYTRPVGAPVGAAPTVRTPLKPHDRRRAARISRRPAGAFIFASGVEASCPTIDQGSWRLDQMRAAGHYRHWRTDIGLAVELGLSHLRWGPPLHLTLLGPDRFDWSFADQVLRAMRDVDLEPIVDLCHFGLPDWLGTFQNPEACSALGAYAEAFADRYPWVRFYTPVNEIYVCARLSALQGLWNEQRQDERAFVTAVRHLAKANVLMVQAILRRRKNAVFVNSESSEFFQPCCPDADVVRVADFENERRFLALDLIYAHPVCDAVRGYLLDHGMPAEEYAWFMRHRVPRRSILGIDYYDWNEKLIDTDGRARALGELFGWYVIASQYYQRYRRPLMHTETNCMDAREAPRWLWRQWHNVQLIHQAGVPVVGFTWFSLVDQIDWDIAMSAALGSVNPVGLFDLNRDVRPVGQAYRHLIRTFQDAAEVRDCRALRSLLR
jgi:beta-glucosidase/6-phospho-beta-glucosidase/beta-galactosidase